MTTIRFFASIIMKLIKKIEFHDVKRRFALGELGSEFWEKNIAIYYPNVEFRLFTEDTRLLLNSGDRKKEEEGIARYQYRVSYINSTHKNTQWYDAVLPINKKQLDELWIIKTPEWGERSKNSYKLQEAAEFIYENQGFDGRVDSIISALGKNKVELTGITFLAKSEDGPYVIVEGTGRMVAIYCNVIINGNNVIKNNEIQITVGISQDNWHFCPF